MKKTYLFLVGLILYFNLQSQVSQFNDSSMYGGKIQAYAKNSTCVLVATDGGIFKTTNEGQSWTNVTHTFDPNAVSCENIVSIGNNFYARSNGNNSSGIYTSNDNGANWSALSFSSWWPQSMGKLSNTLYVVGSDMTGGRLYSSVDGSSWTPKAILWSNQWQGGNCKLLSFNQNNLYISLNDTLYYTSDGNIIDTVSFNGLGIFGFSDGDDRIDGDALGNLYYRKDNAIYKYNFTSEIWNDISTSQISSGYQIMDFSVTDNAVFLFTMNSTLGMKFYKSTNQGSSFTEINTGLTVPMISNIIEVSTNGFIGNGLYDQIMFSSNGGNTWSSNTTQYIATYTGNLTLSGNSLLFSKEPKGIVRTSDQGLSWATANNGIPGFFSIAYFVNEIIQVKDTLFLFCQPDPNIEQAALYKSSNNGISWTPCLIPAPYNVGEYSFAGKCDSALFINHLDTNSSNYNLIVSFNDGASWTNPNTLNSTEPIYLKGPKNCLFVFYASPNNSWEDFTNVYKANNFGASLTDLNTSNLFNNSFLIKRVYGDRWDKGGAMMDFDAVNNKAIFVVRDRTMGNNLDRLYLHNMSSNVWSEIITTGLPANYLANFIKYIGNNKWLLATSTGLYRSTDGGTTWTITHNTNSWQNGIIVNSIQMIGNNAFLGTIANGVWLADVTVGILEQLKDDDLQVFPNPTADIMNVIIPNFNGKIASVSLYSFDGKEIINKTIIKNQFQIDMKNFASGSYVVVINSNNNIYRRTIIRK